MRDCMETMALIAVALVAIMEEWEPLKIMEKEKELGLLEPSDSSAQNTSCCF